MRGGVTKHTVIAICGHDYEVTLNGSHIGRMIKLDRLEKELCSHCQGKMSNPIEGHDPGDEQPHA